MPRGRTAVSPDRRGRSAGSRPAGRRRLDLREVRVDRAVQRHAGVSSSGRSAPAARQGRAVRPSASGDASRRRLNVPSGPVRRCPWPGPRARDLVLLAQEASLVAVAAWATCGGARCAARAKRLEAPRLRTFAGLEAQLLQRKRRLDDVASAVMRLTAFQIMSTRSPRRRPAR